MAIELSNLHPAPGSRRKYKRMGRGNASGKGTTAGKGTKGQRARQGGRKGLRQLGQKWATQATPKLAGAASIYPKSATVALNDLNKFKAGDTINFASLVRAGIVSQSAGMAKIVDGGKLTKKVSLKGLKVSAGARKKIEALGGTIN
jgi:large subunit ribosomal protein L15